MEISAKFVCFVLRRPRCIALALKRMSVWTCDHAAVVMQSFLSETYRVIFL